MYTLKGLWIRLQTTTLKLLKILPQPLFTFFKLKRPHKLEPFMVPWQLEFSLSGILDEWEFYEVGPSFFFLSEFNLPSLLNLTKKTPDIR